MLTGEAHDGPVGGLVAAVGADVEEDDGEPRKKTIRGGGESTTAAVGAEVQGRAQWR